MDCPICFEQMTHYYTTNCNHKFHYHCLLQHYNYNGSSCPNCRNCIHEFILDSNPQDFYETVYFKNTFTDERFRFRNRLYVIVDVASNEFCFYEIHDGIPYTQVLWTHTEQDPYTVYEVAQTKQSFH